MDPAKPETIPQLTTQGQRSGFHGYLVIDKPLGMSSRTAVNWAERWFLRSTKIGHTGTLDPLATGVLVLCIGQATKQAHVVQAMTKIYRSRFQFGATSTTDDADGKITAVPMKEPLTLEATQHALLQFLGTIQQTPPPFSAIKLKGRRAYKLARAGKVFSLTSRPVRIDRIEVLKLEPDAVELEIECGKGTYVRSLARDLGIALGTGAYVTNLRRTRVGPFTDDMAIGFDLPKEYARRALLETTMEHEGTILKGAEVR